MRALKKNNFLRTLSRACAGLLLTTTFVAAAATADARTTTFQLDIPAQSLGDALQALALASQHKLLYDTVLVKGKSSLALKGEFTTEQAVREMLTGTGLSYEVSDGLVLIRSKDTQQTVISGNDESEADGRSLQEMRRAGNDGLLMAQAEATKAGEQSAAQKSSSDPQDSEDSAAKLQEIVVTAQKREERLQDVPISISVLDGKDLDSSTFEGVTEALRTVPGVMTTATIQGGATLLAIRGIGPANPVFSGPSPTAYYLDSMSLNLAKTAVVPDANLYDLERVEVLRGPQGTLYGAGGMGGVVRVLTHDADLSDFDFKARTSVSSTQDSDTPSYRGDFALNAPIIPDVLAARATLSYQDASGWIDRPFKKDANDGQMLNARLKVRAQPTDRLSLGLTAWLSRNDTNAAYTNDNQTIVRSIEEPIETDYDIFGVTVGYDFANFSVRNTSSYIEYQNSSVIDTTPFLGSNSQLTLFDAEVFSNEVNLYSTLEGHWRWTLGAVYRDSDDLTLAQLLNPASSPNPGIEQSKSVAVFGELTRLFFDGRFELTAGLRYFEDKLTSLTGTLGEYEQTTFDALTPRIVLSAHPNEQMTVYASYAEGFRSGYNQSAGAAATTFPAVDPDTLRNYQVGLKGNWLGGRLSFEAAAFYLDWLDTHQSLLVGTGPNNGPPFGPAGVNAKSASGPGVEFALTSQPLSGLMLAATLGWNDLAFDEDVQSGFVFLYPKGSRPNYSTETTASASISYDFPIGSGGFEGRLLASANYSSALPIRRVSATAEFKSTGDPLTFARASFGVTLPDASWRATLFVDNLTNEGGAFLRNFLGIQDFDMYARPRTVGLQLEYRLGR